MALVAASGGVPVPGSYCQCGCGQRTTIARKTNSRDGYVRGQPYRFACGHQVKGEVDAVLFRGWLEEQVAKYGREHVAGWADVSSDRVRILVRGYYWHKTRIGTVRRYEIKRVTLGLVDRFLTGADQQYMLDELAPLL